MSRLVRLYPGAWRSRYEVELVELLGERPPTILERFDVIRGAVDAHLHPQVLDPGETGPSPTVTEDARHLARNLGFGAVGGAALWIVAFAVTLVGPVRYDGYGAYRDGSAAFPFLLGAVSLLGGGLGGQLVSLPRNARLARFGAAVALLFLIVWGLQPWQFWTAGTMVVGLAVLAIGAYRAGAWPTRTSVAVVLSCLAVVVMIVIGYAISVDRMTGAALLAVAAAAFVPAWLGIGTSLISPPGRSVTPRA
ncbi:MAG: hypothetical protein QOJ75_1658 [Chloroflexota bacterium]|nr:hypothetical protein [Chloroflexota bacterium]